MTNGYGMAGFMRLQNKLIIDQSRVLPSSRRRIAIKDPDTDVDLNTSRFGEQFGEEAKQMVDQATERR